MSLRVILRVVIGGLVVFVGTMLLWIAFFFPQLDLWKYLYWSFGHPDRDVRGDVEFIFSAAAFGVLAGFAAMRAYRLLRGEGDFLHIAVAASGIALGLGALSLSFAPLVPSSIPVYRELVGTLPGWLIGYATGAGGAVLRRYLRPGLCLGMATLLLTPSLVSQSRRQDMLTSISPLQRRGNALEGPDHFVSKPDHTSSDSKTDRWLACRDRLERLGLPVALRETAGGVFVYTEKAAWANSELHLKAELMRTAECARSNADIEMPFWIKVVDQESGAALASYPGPDGGALEAQSPSFDCARATAPVDIFICLESDLSVLDVVMADQWRSDPRSSLDLQAQRAWLQSRGAKCGLAKLPSQRQPTLNCLADLYQQRIMELDAIHSSPPPAEKTP